MKRLYTSASGITIHAVEIGESPPVICRRGFQANNQSLMSFLRCVAHRNGKTARP